MKKTSFFLILSCWCTLNFGNENIIQLSAPDPLPHTTRTMNAPEFWIKLHPFPEKIILTPNEINIFNHNTEKKFGLIKDLAKFERYLSAQTLRQKMQADLVELQEAPIYKLNGEVVSKDFYRRMEKAMELDQIVTNGKIHFAYVYHATSQRSVPSDEQLVESPQEPEFDMLQNNYLDIGTPVAVLHETKNKIWAYVEAPNCHGWVKRNDLVFCQRCKINWWLHQTEFAVGISQKTDLFLDPQLTKFYGSLSMGSRLPLIKAEKNNIAVLVPIKDQSGKFATKVVYLNPKNVHLGYLNYTPANIIKQAFKALAVPYGWKCTPDQQDCSGLIQKVFATVGIILPRNAHEQRLLGQNIGDYSTSGNAAAKLKILREKAVGGITILWMEGHIMLFLGIYHQQPYIIHATYEYLENTPNHVVEKIINKVVVSDLSLGENSSTQSILQRILAIKIITGPSPYTQQR